LNRKADVKFLACQMTVESFGFDRADLIDTSNTLALQVCSNLRVKPISACISEAKQNPDSTLPLY